MKSQLDQYEDEIRRRLCRGETQKSIARSYHVSQTTLCKWLKYKRRKWMVS